MSAIAHQLVFLAFAGMTTISALLVVALKNLLHAAVALFFCLTGVAGLYVLLGADFIGLTQLLVYAGGVVILIIFGVFLTARIYDVSFEFRGRGANIGIGIAIALALMAVIFQATSSVEWATQEAAFSPTTKELGRLFLTKYLLPFELISLLLLFVMVGAVMLVRKELKEP
ncbi:MAG TPA: NADH-quinone oxidoreductase subunit J [Bdellovibrionota bacterium]|nr:NADH-quinone oxidoreductase subunit J [Bdellovibrionota bacterium]